MSKQLANTPALEPRRTYNDQVSEALSSRFMLSVLALLSLLIALGAVGGLIHVAAQSKFVPYVFERSCTQRLAAAGPAIPLDVADPDSIEVAIKAALADWITNARLVTPDRMQQERAVNRVYAYLSPGDAGRQQMNDWYNADTASNPSERAATVTVDSEISSVLPQSADTWQVEWIERVSDRDGTPKEEFRMRALLTVYRRSTTRETKEEELRANPLGMFVKSFSWSRQL